MKRQRRDWNQIFNDWQQSGMNAAAFCRSKGLPPSEFYRQRKAKDLPVATSASERVSISEPKPTVQVVEIKRAVEPAAEASPTLKLTTPQGLILEVYL